MESDPKKSMTIGSFLKKGHILFGSYKCCFFWRTLDHLSHEKKKKSMTLASYSSFPAETLVTEEAGAVQQLPPLNKNEK